MEDYTTFSKMKIVWITVISLVLTLQPVESEDCSAKCRSCINNIADCSQKSLINPPKDFPTNTRILMMDGNFLRVLGRRSFQSLRRVEVVKVSRNAIRVIRTHAFKNLPSVMTIDLSSNKIMKIYPRAFEGIKKVKTLTLSNNKLRDIGGIFDKLPSLRQLNLAFNLISDISETDLQNNTEIRYLDLRNNKITNIHANAFSNLLLLRYLFLNNNPLVTLPDLEFSSNVLQLVDFTSCKLEAIPKTFPPSLRDLRLVNNKISIIEDEDFTNITHLKLLALNGNRIRTIGYNAFRHLEHLQEIWMRDNKLANIPYGLPVNLRKLYMDSNHVYEIENNLFGKDSKLDYLTVERNRLTKIDSNAFRGLKFLKTLNFQGNRLKVIKTGTFEDLRNLSTLTISNNPLVEIEKGAFKDLFNLTYLHMSYITTETFNLKENFLTAMPNLKKLDLMNSPKLAQSLMNIIADTFPMEKLKEIVLTYNDLDTLPPELKTIFPVVQAVTVDGNALICDKRLLWLKKWMMTSDVKFFSYEEPRCGKPYEVKGLLIKDLPEDQFSQVVEDQPQMDYQAFAAAMKAREIFNKDFNKQTANDSDAEEQNDVRDEETSVSVNNIPVNLSEQGSPNITSNSEDRSKQTFAAQTTAVKHSTPAIRTTSSTSTTAMPSTAVTQTSTTKGPVQTRIRPWRWRIHRKKRHHKNKAVRNAKRSRRRKDGKRRRRIRCNRLTEDEKKKYRRCRTKMRRKKKVTTRRV